MTFESLAHGQNNNIQLMRMLAASAVVVSHAFPLALGKGAWEPLREFGYSLGSAAVWVFFTLSGFLVAKSAERKSFREFTEARVRRIFPALAVVAILTAFVLGPLFTSDPGYFRRLATWEYVPRVLSLYFVSHELPGLFVTNPYGQAVNGPLWTLYYEVGCYAVLALLTYTGALKRPVLCLALFAAAWPFLPELWKPLSLAFVTGVAAWKWRTVLPATPWPLALFFLTPVAPVAFGYSALWLAGLRSPLLAYNRLGDYSYGLYIYAFPIGQIVATQWHHPLAVLAVGYPLAMCFAVASWHFIERPALNWRRKAKDIKAERK